MSERRFTDKPDIDPGAVRALPADHAALTGNRTLFPSTVVEVTKDAPARLLVSGKNNRKLGATVEKGKFKGYALYGLSLEERATCPTDCSARGFCYGNGMQMARRHRIGDADVFFDRLGFEICDLLEEHKKGLLIRLHVLGDFPSVEYVAFWADVLNEHERVAVYGYTHRRATSWDGDAIGDAIQSLKDAQPERFRIRWSSDVGRDDAARLIDYTPKTARIDEGIVCPAQTNATACCASCGLCWEGRHDAIVFIKHGPKVSGSALVREAVKVNGAETDARPIAPLVIPVEFMPRRAPGAAPILAMAKPEDLHVEPVYQRDLSPRSIKHVRRIVAEWDWARFKPPICARTASGLFVVDGQHTAIAAASHPMVTEIPVLIVDAPELTKRAGSFVSHNSDRLAMTAHQLFHAAAAAGELNAVALKQMILAAGGVVPKYVSPPRSPLRSEIVAINDLRATYASLGPAKTRRIVDIAVISGVTPIKTAITRGLRFIFTEQKFARVAALPDAQIALALASFKDIEAASRKRGGELNTHRYRACAELIAAKAAKQTRVAA